MFNENFFPSQKAEEPDIAAQDVKSAVDYNKEIVEILQKVGGWESIVEIPSQKV